MLKSTEIYLFAILSVMAGCATYPVHPEDAYPLESRYVESHDLDDGEPVTVVRDGGTEGATCRAWFFIDDREIARLNTEDKFEFKLPKGEYTFEVRPYGFCEHTASSTQIEIDHTPNIYRITFTGGSILLRPHFTALEDE